MRNKGGKINASARRKIALAARNRELETRKYANGNPVPDSALARISQERDKLEKRILN